MLGACVSMCMPVSALGHKKKVSDLLELVLQEVLSSLIHVLGTKRGLTGRAANALHQVTIPQPPSMSNIIL